MENGEKIRERFEHDTVEHAMTVLQDDGLYRHLRFKKPGTSIYYFDIVTWPGYLAVVGDMGHFMFQRVRDMLEFFESSRGSINPRYWAEKLQGPGPAHQAVMEFDPDAYAEYVQEHGLDVADDWDGPYSTERAHYLLVEQAGVDPCDLPSLERFSTQFLWCCWAIVWGIGKYRTHATTAVGR